MLLFRDSPATADIFINDSVQVATDTEEPKIYETTQEKTLRKGQISVLVPVRAIIKGQDGVTEARTIKMMVQPVLGIDGITNPREISPTGREETDEELRERAKHALEAAGKTTANSIKYALMSIPELSGKDIRVEEDFSQGNGLVRVYIDTEGTGDIVEKIDQKIFEIRAAGIRVVHNLSKSEDEITSKLKIDLIKTPVIPKVMLSLEDPSIASSKKESIKKQVSSAIKAYFGKLKIGESVLKNKLMAEIFGVESVKNVQFIEFADEIKAGSYEKIVLGKDGPWVAIADSPVFVDAKVHVLITDRTLDKDRIEKSLKDKTDTFIKSRGKKISFNDFMDALKGNGYNIKALAFDIEYSESGLIKRDIRQGEEIISDNEAFVLRSVELKFEE